MQLPEQLKIYRENIISDGMLETLVASLGNNDIAPMKKLGVGYLPAENTWIYPEYDHAGKLVGLVRREHVSGSKFVMKGSKRGMVYIDTEVDGTTPYKQAKQRTRVNRDLPCPLCGKIDWCVIIGDVHDPHAVLCPRTEAGHHKNLDDAGYLHLMKGEEYDIEDDVVLIVEGFTDWYTGESMGLRTFAKPTAMSSVAKYKHHFTNKTVIIIGEPDKAGLAGMEKTFLELHNECEAIKILAPGGIKDLREWRNKTNLTKGELLAYAYKYGCSELPTNVFKNKEPITIAKAWLKDTHKKHGTIGIRNYSGKWYSYEGSCYKAKNIDKLRGDLYEYLEGRKYVETKPDGSEILIPLIGTRSAISDVIDACNHTCVVENSPPHCMDGWGENMNIDNSIVFSNGILDVEKYFAGGMDLIDHSASFFNLTSIPHRFNPKAKSTILVPLMEEILSDDQECIDLLQEWFGYNLIPSQKYESLMMFVGLPRSGKGTIMDILTNVLGGDQCAVTNFRDLVGSFGLHQLLGKLSIQLRDASLPKNVDSAQALELVKTITGGDPVAINRKFKESLANIRLTCRFTIAVNTLPELPDSSNAFESRLLLMPFAKCYRGKENRELKDMIRSNSDELEGVIMWALQGLKRLRKNKKFTMPTVADPLIKEFRSLTTPVSEFVENYCVMGEEDIWIEELQLFNCWRGWCREGGLSPGSRATFTQDLMSLFLKVRRDKMDVSGRRTFVYRNIKLTSLARNHFLKEGF